MAREFGQFDSAAWRVDDDWRALTTDAQWLYMLLVSQTDLSAAGVLNLAVTRWQNMCADMTPERFTEAMAVLEGRRFIFTDLAMEELLVRTFARRTQWGNGKRVAALTSAISAMHSTRLRRALAVSLAQIGQTLPGLPAVTPQTLAEFSPEGMPERLAEPLRGGSPDGSPNGSRARAPHTPDAILQTPYATDCAEPAKSGRRRDELWDATLDVCRVDPTTITDSARGAYNRAVAQLRGVKATPDDVRIRAEIYRRKFPDVVLTPTALARHWAELTPTADVVPINRPGGQSRNAQILTAARERARLAEGDIP